MIFKQKHLFYTLSIEKEEKIQHFRLLSLSKNKKKDNHMVVFLERNFLSKREHWKSRLQCRARRKS